MARCAIEELEARLKAYDALLERHLAANPLRYIRHARLGVIPLKWWAKQREFFEKFTRCGKICAWVGPNRPGKSTAAAALVAAQILGWPATSWPELPEDLAVGLGPPARVGCVTVSKEKSRDGQQRVIADFIPRRFLAGPRWNPRTGLGGEAPKLVLTNGSTVDFLSDLQRGQSFEEFTWHLCWIDEAVDEWVKDRVVARLVDAGGKLIITAVGELAWLNRLARMHLLASDSVEPAPQGFIEAVTDSTMRDNELITEQEIASAVTLYGGPGSRQARMRVEGLDTLAEGLVLERFDSRFNVEPDGPVPRTWTRYEYADPGYDNPFGWGFLAADPEGRFHILDEIYVRRLHPAEVAALVKSKRNELGYAEPYIPAVIDPAADEDRHWGRSKVSVRMELAEHGVQTVPGKKSAGSVQRREQTIDALFHNRRLFVRQKCVWHLFEIANYRKGDPDPHTGEFLADREKRIQAHNHLIDGLGYLIEEKPIYVPQLAVAAPEGSAAADLAKLRAERQNKARVRSWS